MAILDGIRFSDSNNNVKEYNNKTYQDLKPVKSIDFFGYSNSSKADKSKILLKKVKKEVINSEIKLKSSCEELSDTVTKTLGTSKEEIGIFRKNMKIKVSGDDVPLPIATFGDMKVDKEKKQLLLRNIEKSEYSEPTAIQMQAIPSMLAKKDTLGIAPTGSGKTAAFVIPMLASMEKSVGEIMAVVLAPTRELAKQIHSEVVHLSIGKKLKSCLLTKATAGTVADTFASNEKHKPAILIATPLRLVQLIQGKQIDLSSVECICFDEADRLFEMGFIKQIDEVLAACTNPKVQRCMFSATMPQGVEDMAESILRKPNRIVIGNKNTGNTSINQQLCFVGKEEGKLVALKQLIQQGFKPPALLFVQNKERAQELCDELKYDGINIDSIHADKSKEKRDMVMQNFRTGKIWVLVCTDLMSRGIDFKSVQLVINYDFPQSAVSYIHRIGRTGRAGQSGKAVTYYTERDMIYLRAVANVVHLSGCHVPDWMLKLKKNSTKVKRGLAQRPPKRYRISTASIKDLQKAKKKKVHPAVSLRI